MSAIAAHELLRENRAEIRRIAASHGAINIRVFGSAARGEDRADSDIDLLVDLERGRSLLDLIAVKQDLEDLLGRTVDVEIGRASCRERVCQYV
jgi:predicted nucleotidyltransferase